MQTDTAEKEPKLPDFEVINDIKWKEIRTKMGGANWYGKSVVEFAARWANMMEQELAKGASVDSCAETTAIALDKEMQTADNVYGHAVEVLGLVWRHGPALKERYGI